MRFVDAGLWWLLSIAAVIGWKLFWHGSLVASEIVATGIAGAADLRLDSGCPGAGFSPQKRGGLLSGGRDE